MDIRRIGLFALLMVAARPQQDRQGIDFFEQKIRPVLVDRCYSCHSAKAEKVKGGLLLDTREGTSRVISSGRLLQAIRYTDEDLQMPPKGRLTAAQVADFEAWVDRGAPDPRGGTASAPKADHWAFKPVRDPHVPEVRLRSWPKSPLDHFVLAKLEEKGLRPAPPADRRTLLRRATIDLTGLPPTPEEIESDEPFEKVVDRLLASPHYGERWGRHWLDLARYADTKGYIFDERRFAYSWAYRDWVIRALNEDMPYDRFVMLQIAADQSAQDPRDLAAMGFLTIGRKFLNNVPDIIDDRLDVVFRSLQGLSIGCARCHDHKYDPIPTKDYYSLYGVFASSREPEELPLAGPPRDTPVYRAYLKERDSREAEVVKFRESRGAATVAELKTSVRIAEYLLAAHEMRDLTDLQLRPEAKRRKLNVQVLPRWWFFLKNDPMFAPRSREEAECFAVVLSERDDILKRILFDPVPMIENIFYPDGGPIRKAPLYPVELLLDEPDLKKLRDLQKQVRELEFTHAGAPARAMTLEDAEPVTPRVFIRGNKATLGEEVPRRFLSILSASPFTQGSGRLELARAIAAAENPLTARVMANRIWLHHFGAGIVRTPSDFGLRSEPPSHPELLDWLASRLAATGSIKQLHRTILLSSTWQQRSEGDPETVRADPENLLLGRMNARRLDLESMRDSLLAAAGRLDRRAGGRGDDIATSRRRTVYATVNRNTLPGFFRTFDFASPDTHVPQRVMTTVPQQALLLMNSPFVLEQARGLASRPDVARLEPRERIDRLYRLLFGRAASEKEAALGLVFIGAQAWEHYAQVLLLSNEFAYVD